MVRRLRCRIGDLAILIKPGRNTGKIVCVEARAADRMSSAGATAKAGVIQGVADGRLHWFIRSAGTPFVYSVEPFLWNVYAFVGDHDLVPIRPPGRRKSTTTKKRTPQEVVHG